MTFRFADPTLQFSGDVDSLSRAMIIESLCRLVAEDHQDISGVHHQERDTRDRSRFAGRCTGRLTMSVLAPCHLSDAEKVLVD